jgi:hypothetical protein
MNPELKQSAIIAGVMTAAAMVWGGVVVWKAVRLEYEPPIGALCMALPSIGLLIGARVVWSSAKSRNDWHGFDVIDKK